MKLYPIFRGCGVLPTYISTNEGWLYCAIVKDLCTKQIVGYVFSEHIDSNHTQVALNMAVLCHRPPAGLIVVSNMPPMLTRQCLLLLSTKPGRVQKGSILNGPTQSLMSRRKQTISAALEFRSLLSLELICRLDPIICVAITLGMCYNKLLQMLYDYSKEKLMKNSDIIKEIRSRLSLSQMELAEKLGVSFATVNRWEKGRCDPSQIAQNAIRQLCTQNKIDYSQFVGNSIIVSDDSITLYHGSKSGIDGIIQPNSRDRCDFGRGFYMGTDRSQPLTLICNYPKARLYTVKVLLSGLKILDIEVGIDWALLIAFNRGKMKSVKGSSIYNRFAAMADGCDMIIGYIANDRMFVVLDRFFNGEITDAALIHSLSALKLGKQYVALTEKACGQIEITEEKFLTNADRETLKKESEENRSKGIALAEEICRQYRREGRFFDEILKAGE